MPLILAIEPDRHQASQLTNIVRSRLHAELVIEATAERALAALGDRVPDLILTAALLSPKDEAALADRLRALDSAAAHIHTITVPVLASPRSRPRIGGMLSALRREKPQPSEVDGCDPAVFAEQCATYLEQAVAERRVLASLSSEDAHQVEKIDSPEPAAAAAAAMTEEFDPSPLVEAVDQEADTVDEAAVFARAQDDEAMCELEHEQPCAEQPPEEHAPSTHVDAGEVGYVSTSEDVTERSLDHVERTVEEAVAQVIDEAMAEESLAAAVAESLDETMGGADPASGPDALAAPVVDDGIQTVEPVAATESKADTFDEHLLDDSPLFELISEPENDSIAGHSEPQEDADSYIELDLSEFLDQTAQEPALMVASAAPEQRESDDPGGWTGATGDPPPSMTAATLQSAPAGAHDEWEDVVAALRRDAEHLEAGRAAPTRLPKPLKKAPRQSFKGKPVQDEWGFFDPEQCGFAALLAKLDEVTAGNDPKRRRKRA